MKTLALIAATVLSVCLAAGAHAGPREYLPKVDLYAGAAVGTAENLVVRFGNNTLWASLDSQPSFTSATLGIEFVQPLLQNNRSQSLFAGQSASCDPTFRGEIRLPSGEEAGLRASF